MFPLKTTLSTLMCFCMFITSAQYSQPYKCEKKKCTFLLSAGTIGLGLGYYMHTQTPTLSLETISKLDPANINRFDRIATNYSSLKAKKASDYFFFSSFALPSLFLANKKSRSDFGNIGLMYGEVLFINYALTNIVKKSFLRSRPLVYNSDFVITDKTQKNSRYSFFSGHASVVSSNCFFTAKVFSDYFPDSKWKPLVWGVAATAPAITGYLRVRAGKHYPSDVITGYTVGALVGILIPQLHKRCRNKFLKENMTMSVMPTGGYFSVQF